MSPASTSCARRSSSRRAAAARRRRWAAAAGGRCRATAIALQCRITTEDPENNFIPDYGHILTYRSAGGFGIRLDGGIGVSPARSSRPYYDSLLVKVTAWGTDVRHALPAHGPGAARIPHSRREDEYSVPRKRGATTRVSSAGEATTTFIDKTPELFKFTPRRDRATKLLDYIGDVIVNGNPRGRRASRCRSASAPGADSAARIRRRSPPGHAAAAAANWAPKNSPSGRASRNGCCSPTRRCATRTSRCWRRACAPTTWSPLRTSARTGCRSCSAWRCGAARRSTPRCGSCTKTRGSGCGSCAQHSRTSVSRCCFAASNAVGYTNYPDNVVADFVQARRRRRASTSSASSIR